MRKLSPIKIYWDRRDWRYQLRVSNELSHCRKHWRGFKVSVRSLRLVMPDKKRKMQKASLGSVRLQYLLLWLFLQMALNSMSLSIVFEISPAMWTPVAICIWGVKAYRPDNVFNCHLICEIPEFSTIFQYWTMVRGLYQIPTQKQQQSQPVEEKVLRTSVVTCDGCYYHFDNRDQVRKSAKLHGNTFSYMQKQWVNCVSNPFATGHWRCPPYESLRQKRVNNDKSVNDDKNKTICMHCVVCTVTSVVFMQSVSDYAATSCTTRNKFHDLRSMAAKVKSAWEPGCWFRHFLSGTMMTTATSILMMNTSVTIIMQLWHLAWAGSVSNTGLGSCCKHDFKQFFSNMISFENFWTVTPVSYCHCH